MQIRFWNVMCVCVALTASACGSSASSTEETQSVAEATPTAGGEQTAPATAEATSNDGAAAKTEAQPAEPPAPVMPKYGITVVTKVKDVATWQAVFDGDVEARKAAGFLGHAQSEVVGQPKTVVLWFPAMDISKVDAFLASPELKAKMKEAGVVGKPTVSIGSPVEMNMPEPAPGQAPVYQAALMVSQSVKDFAAFKTAFDAAAPSFKAANVTGYALSQDVKDPNTVYIYANATTIDTLKSWWNNKDTKKWNKDAGLKGAAKTLWTQEKAWVMYQ